MMKNKIKNFFNCFLKWNPPLILIIILLILFSIFLSLKLFRIDNDFWFLINTGKYIINNGFPAFEPFTMHSDLSITIQQWLTCVIFYFIYDKFDVYGMFILVSIVSLIVKFLVYKICMLVSDNKIKLSFVITILIGLLFDMFFMTTRPQIFDCLFLLLEIYLLELYIKKGNRLYLIGLPIISLFMINLHASIWLMLFVFLVSYFIDGIVKSKHLKNDKYSIVPLIFASIVMFLVGFINPCGIKGITYLFNSYGVDVINNFVGEMKPVTINSVIGVIVFVLIFTLFISYYINKDNGIKLRYLLLFLGTCYLGLSHYKGILFLYIGSVLSISYNFKNLSKEKKEVKYLYSSRFMNIFLFCFCTLFFACYGYLIYSSNIKEKNKHYLYDVANYLDDISSGDVTVYTSYNDGAYMEYRGYKCYIDPRAEVFLKSNNNKEDIFDEYVFLQHGKIHYSEFLNKYGFDYLVVGSDDILYNYIEIGDGYEIVYENYTIRYCFGNDSVSYRIYKRIGI